MTRVENFKRISEEVAAFGAKLLVVTKNRSLGEIFEVLEAGAGFVGENRVQEGVRKFAQIDGVEKHLIGHLQSNKVREAVRAFDVIESIDSLRLLRLVDAEGLRQGRCVRVFLQVNISRDENKFGFAEKEVSEAVKTALGLKNVRLEGLMTIVHEESDERATLEYFDSMKRLYDRVCAEFSLSGLELSMGMSGDYKLALRAGATLVRIGSAIFE